MEDQAARLSSEVAETLAQSLQVLALRKNFLETPALKSFVFFGGGDLGDLGWGGDLGGWGGREGLLKSIKWWWFRAGGGVGEGLVKCVRGWFGGGGLGVVSGWFHQHVLTLGFSCRHWTSLEHRGPGGQYHHHCFPIGLNLPCDSVQIANHHSTNGLGVNIAIVCRS